jgi:glycosyltransferase involved in cell wall biosynthesis
MEDSTSVAVVELVGGHGGMNPYDFGLCKGLLSAGARVSLYTCDETRDPGLPGLRFVPIFKGIYGKSHILRRALRFLIGCIGVASSAMRNRERVVHFHIFQAGAVEPLFVLLMKLCRRKIVLTVHDVDSLSRAAGRRRLTEWLYESAEGIVVHNAYSMRELAGLGVAARKLRVIPHGHYLDTMHPLPPREEARRALGIANPSKVVLFFGQIKEVKGLDLLIAAMPLVLREIPEAVLVIAGRPLGIDFSRYEKLIDGCGVRSRCHLHIRYIPDDEVSVFYAAADLVALPYRRIYQSGVLLMAMTYGCPVVVSDLPGMTAIVEDGSNGYVFADGSSQALAQTLIRALRDSSGGGVIAQRAAEYVRQNHDWTAIGRSTLEVYRSALAGRMRASTAG